jgi:hypothetical protein
LSYGIILLLAAGGALTAARRREDHDLLLLGWVLVTVLGMVLPIPLQRRLSIGLGIPMGLLAGMGLRRAVGKAIRSRSRSRVRALVIAMSALTPVFLIVLAAAAALGPGGTSPRSWFYLGDGEWSAVGWLRQRSESTAGQVVLCAPQAGAFVPAWSGLRVVYGHPFETVRAETRRRNVEAYWRGDMDDVERTAFLQRNRVDYVLLGPRERGLTTPAWEGVQAGALVFERGDTQIYRIDAFH